MPAEAETVTEGAREIVANALGLQAAEVSEESSMHNLPAWDSLGHLRIIMSLEEKLGRRLTSEEVFEIEGVGTIRRLLKAQ